MKGKWLNQVVFGSVFVLLGGVAQAQRTTANLYGIVKDSSGAVVPGIKVGLINELTGIGQEAGTDERGEFSATFIPVGRYTVKVEAQGFKTFVQRGLELGAGQQLRFSIVLQLGEVTQQIEVTAEAPLLQNAAVQLTDTVTRWQLDDLPLSRRDFTQLLTLQNGMARGSQELVQINGLASGGITVTVDGVDAAGDPETPSLSMFQGANQINVLSQEAIQEVNVSKGVISAEVGRTFSGNINLISKSGTNDFHGSLFENWQNDILNARYALLAPAAKKPTVRFNQFGGSVGGPVIKNKAFFFFAYEGYRQSNLAIQTNNVPTPEFKAQAIAAFPAYKQVLDLFPAPTATYAPGASNAFWQGTSSDIARDNHLVARGDYQLSSGDMLSGRFTHGRPKRIQPRPVPSNAREYIYSTDSANLSWIHSAPSWTSEARIGVNYTSSDRLDRSYATNVPGIDVQGNFSVAGELLILKGHSYSGEEIVAKTIGRHTLKFGGSYTVQAPGRFDEETPIYRYSNAADFLANRPNRVQFTFGVPRYYAKSWQPAVFVQDDFRVKPNLVLNLGLRYEYYSVLKDQGRLFYNPGNLANALASPTRARPADSAYNGDFNNILPRVGLAWSLGKDSKTVIRSGFGVSVAPLNLRLFSGRFVYDPNILSRYQFTGSDITTLGLVYPLGNAEGLQIVKTRTVLKGVSFFEEDHPNPYAMQWTLDIQRQLTPTLMLQTGYVGTRGLKVSMAHNYNQPNRITNVRPFPHVLTASYDDASDMSSYHAWQTSLRKRLSHDLAFNVNYTWSRNMSISQGDFWPGANIRVQDEANFRADYGPNYLDRTHTFNWDFAYTAPFDRWLNAGSVMKQVIGGWELNGIVSASTGSPLNVIQASAYEFSRPDYTGADPYLQTSNRFQYLNPAGFALVPLGSGGPVRPGNLGKNNLRSPGSWNLNLTAGKEFKILEKYSLRFRADMFNAFNHPNLGGPVADLTRPATFGLIQTVSNARTMQLGLRFAF